MWLVSRFQHLKSIAAWGWALVALGWSALANADLAVSKYGSAAFQAKWNSWWHPNWSGEVWPIGLLVIALLMIFEGSYRHSKDQEAGSVALNVKLQEIEDAKPNLLLLRTEVNPSISFGPHFKAPFVKARLINKPKGNSEKSVARDVRARISFFDASTSRPLTQDMDARWDSSTQPIALPKGTSWNSLLPMRFGIEDAQNIDIAFRSGSGEFVAFNNDNYRFQNLTKPGTSWE